MKVKTVSIFITVALLIFGGMILLQNSAIQAKELDGDKYDNVFLSTIDELAKENYSGELKIAASKETLYDIERSTLGYLYEFHVNDEAGYAILIGQEKKIEVAEIFFDAKNPYDGREDLMRIYVSSLNYLVYDSTEANYYFAETMVEVDVFTLNRLKKTAYYSGGGITGSSETVGYITKTENQYAQSKRHPGGSQVPNISNACVAIAAGNIVQYWDRYQENMIYNYTPGSAIGSFYLYKESPDIFDAVATELYYDMQTNSIQPGTSIPQCKSGFTAYCARRNYSLSFGSCMTGGTFNFSLAKQRLEANLPLILFVEAYTAADIFTSENKDSIDYIAGSGNHAMAAFGYKEITYTMSGGTRQDNYLMVATGIVNKRRGYYNVNFNTTIDDAYSINIT